MSRSNQLRLLGELQSANKLLDQAVSFLNQLLVGLIQLVLIEEICSLVPLLARLLKLALQLVDLQALPADCLAQIEQLLRRTLVLALLHEVFKLRDSLHQLLCALQLVIGVAFFHHVEKLEVVAQLLDLEAQVLNLQGHRLVVFDQGRPLLLVDADLLDKILCSCALVIRLLGQSESLISLNKLALRVDDHCLELVTLPDQLLRIRVDLLL